MMNVGPIGKMNGKDITEAELKTLWPDGGTTKTDWDLFKWVALDDAPPPPEPRPSPHPPSSAVQHEAEELHWVLRYCVPYVVLGIVIASLIG